VKPDVFLKTPTIHFEAHSLLDNVLSVSRSHGLQRLYYIYLGRKWHLYLHQSVANYRLHIMGHHCWKELKTDLLNDFGSHGCNTRLCVFPCME